MGVNMGSIVYCLRYVSALRQCCGVMDGGYIALLFGSSDIVIDELSN